MPRPIQGSDVIGSVNQIGSGDILWTVDDLMSFLPAGLLFTQAGAGAVPRTIQSKLRESVTVEDFGAVGDGVTDDTAAIQLADSALAFGGTLKFGNGKTYLTSGAQIRRAGHLEGNGATLILSAAGGAAGAAVLNCVNRVATYSAFTPFSTVQGESVFTIPSGVTVAVGDVLELLSNTIRVAASPADYYHGQFATVESIAGSVARVSAPWYGSFQVNTIRVHRRPDRTLVEGFNIRVESAGAGNPGMPTGVLATGRNITVRGCNIVGNQYAGMGIYLSGDNLLAEGNSIDGFFNVQGILPSGRVGYGVILNGNGCTARRNTISNCKHAVTSASRETVARGILFEDNIISEQSTLTTFEFAGSLDVHANVSDVPVFKNNKISAVAWAFSVRCGAADIVENEVIAVGASAYPAVTYSEVDLANLRVRDNRLAQKDGGHILDPSDANMSGVRIERNRVTNGALLFCTKASVFTMADTVVQGNIINESAACIRLVVSNASGGGKFNNTKLLDNQIKMKATASAVTPIQIASVDTDGRTGSFTVLDVSGNQIDMGDVTGNSYAMTISDSTFTGVRVTGNKVIRQKSGNPYNFRGASITRAVFNGLEVRGNTFDARILFGSGGVAASFIDSAVSGNVAHGVEVSEANASFNLVLSRFSITNNTLADPQNGSLVSFSYQAASTSWAVSLDVMVGGNVLQSGHASSVIANANATGNKLVVSGNTMTGVFTDSSGTYYRPPLGNSTGAAQPFKGATTIRPEGVVARSAAPVAGTWVVNDRVYNSAPTVGQPKSWVCTVAGTPGTWVSEGNL